MAEQVAIRNSNDLTNRIAHPQVCLTESIIGVYTLWRSSVSALNPTIDIKKGTTKEGKPCYDVKVTVVNLEANEKASSVKAKLKLYGTGKLTPADEIKDVGDIGATLSKEVSGWQLETDDPKNGALCVEVVGGFDKTPDLQYALFETNISPSDVSNSVILVIDASGSMSGEKIANAKATAISEIDKLDEFTEVAVFSFGGSASVNMITPFHLPTQAGKASLKATIGAIGAGGNTPLAAAIRRSGAYMHRSARGEQSRTLVILSDGEETCGGNPAAEMAALNGITIR
jgi:Mg-chelatase subunit ChlD